MDDNWKPGIDADGAPCEYNIFTGDVRYPVDEVELTQEEIDALIGELSDNPMSPLPTPIDPHIIDNDFTLELPEENKKTCPDCKGTGEYTGALVVELCQTCKGSGLI